MADTITVAQGGASDGIVSVRFAQLDPFDGIEAFSILQCLLQLWISARLLKASSLESNEVNVPDHDVQMGMVFDDKLHICHFSFRIGRGAIVHRCAIQEGDLNRAIDQLFLQSSAAPLPIKEVSLDFRYYRRGQPDPIGGFKPHVISYEDREE